MLLSTAIVAAGLVAPGVIPAIADVLLVFFAYVASGIFLVLGAIFAFRVRSATVGLARPGS